MCWLLAGAIAFAGGPRWVTGPPYFSTSAVPVAWYTNQLLYFTDPGDLSSYVDHAAADAIVAAAANAWNVPVTSLVLGDGGSLAEHVSGANVYPGSDGLVFPADVQSSNYQAKQIAVIYDSDGSVTDMLLGSGASDPSGCRQNAVTESVDSIVPAGYIQHALLILNGRCTGPAAEQQLQMQYQLMRAFGRILGLGWSQVNDNVFTGSPQPTAMEALNWPIMHPIDIICGPYTYQCLPQPFTLRADDLSALTMLYPIAQNQAPPGKTDSLYLAHEIEGYVYFPTGQGMQGVNVTVRRWHQFLALPETWQTASAVSGAMFKGAGGNPVTGTPATAAGSSGTANLVYEGFYEMARIPMLDGSWDSDVLDTEPINPLYTGQYAVGPYVANQVEPSGANSEFDTDIMRSYQLVVRQNLTPAGAANSCNTATDGVEAAPAATAPQGWWMGTLCAYGHTAWSSLSIKADRSFTIEVTAQDESGFSTMAKAMPVIGVWNATDALKTLPSVASAATAFNGTAYGTTSLTVQSAPANQFRIAIADQRGDGRPDFGYQARVLYADSISPSSVSAEGGAVTITGAGFRVGNAVTVNGVAATVTSWAATSIVATVPSLRALGHTTAIAANVTVTDPSTRGTTMMTGALNYAAPLPSLNLVTAPSGTVFVGDTSAVPFAVKALAADGRTPMANQLVSFTASGDGSVQFGACGGSVCNVMTDASGVASTTVTALAAGSVTVSAASMAGTQNASFTIATRVRTLAPIQGMLYVAAGATFIWTPQVEASDNSASTVGVVVNWQAVSGGIILSPGQSQVNGLGVAETQVSIGPLTAGEQATASACAWTTVCATIAAQGVDPADWRIEVVSGAGQSVGAADVLAPVLVRVTDAVGNAVAGAVVEIHQTIDAWQGPCPDRGRCPVPPDESAQVSSAISDANGLVTVLPLQVVGIAEVTNLVAATGTQGFVSLSLQKQP
ncbi:MULTISPECIES: IPT/TIG domain-containing protein [Acidobacteriaceae]|uniref:IPT/TIG domain-containing protein n=1 Tax=Acidobacteriaceae TaxID=204434 RepID=UPI0020B16915|nr:MULTISPECIES: IPT/TIG domain-containing protein [Acidobacteriaceae]MDW5264709.1 IPT/TIG domain-containing protein [Edaphobacter sp.]